MKKPKKTDEFNAQHVMKGVSLTLIGGCSSIHDHVHRLTFKSDFKSYEESWGSSTR